MYLIIIYCLISFYLFIVTINKFRTLQMHNLQKYICKMRTQYEKISIIKEQSIIKQILQEISQANKKSFSDIIQKQSTSQLPALSIDSQLQFNNQELISCYKAGEPSVTDISHPIIAAFHSLLQTNKQKAQTINLLSSFINNLLEVTIQLEQKTRNAEKENSENICYMHELENIVIECKKQNQCALDRISSNSQQISDLKSQKDYWQNQYYTLNHQFEINLAALAQKNQENVGITKIKEEIETKDEVLQLQILNLKSIIAEKNYKLQEIQELNNRIKMGYKLLEKEIIKISGMFRAIEAQNNQLKSQNQILAAEVQQLYQSGNFVQDSPNMNSFCAIQKEENEKNQEGIFKRTSLALMRQEKEQLYQIKSLSFASSKQSLFSGSDSKPQIAFQSDKKLSKAQITTDQLDKKLPELKMQQKIIQGQNYEERQNKTILKLSKKEFEQQIPQQTKENKGGIDQLIRSIVLRRVRRKTKLSKNKEVIEEKNLAASKLLDNSWRQKVVTNRIRGRSPQFINNSIRKSIQKKDSFIQSSRKNSQLQYTHKLQTMANLSQSRIFSSTEKSNSHNEIKKGSLMDYICEAVITNRIKK